MATQRARMPLVSLGLAIALASTACAGGSGADSGVASLEDVASSDGAPAAEADLDREQALLDFAACMRDQGIDIEDPTVDADGNVQIGRLRSGTGDGGAGVDREATRAARDACAEHLEGLTLGFSRGDDTEFQDRLIEYAQCMRDNGVDMDDPDLSNTGPGAEEERAPGSGPFGSLDRDDPDFQAAQDACEDLLGGFVPGRFGTVPSSDNNGGE